MKLFIKENRLTGGINTRCVYSAWDEASGAGKYTVRRFFRNGRLYVTMSSSVVRSQLQFQKTALLEKMRKILSTDIIYDTSDPSNGRLEDLIIK